MAEYGPKWAHFRVSKKIFSTLTNHYVLDIVILNHNIQNRQERVTFEQENGLKPHFGRLFGPNCAHFRDNYFFSAL